MNDDLAWNVLRRINLMILMAKIENSSMKWNEIVQFEFVSFQNVTNFSFMRFWMIYWFDLPLTFCPGTHVIFQLILNLSFCHFCCLRDVGRMNLYWDGLGNNLWTEFSINPTKILQNSAQGQIVTMKTFNSLYLLSIISTIIRQ
jgi:hypothetical protein